MSQDEKQLAKRYGIPVKTVRLLRFLPNYDPFEQAEDAYFDREAASAYIDLFEDQIKHVKGSKRGQPFILSDWQLCIMANVYGWKRPSGLRRFSEIFIYVPKKQGKSAFTAGWLLVEMKYGPEHGADFYSAASGRDQTRNVFDHVAGMVRFDAQLGDGLVVYGGQAGNVKSVVYPDAENTYRCLASDADTVDGVNPQMNVIDELHRHKSAALTTVLEYGTAARDQPLNVYTTTADFDRPSMCNDKLKFARNVCKNGGKKSKPGYAPWFLPCVYEVFPADYKGDSLWWTRPKVWAKANPNYNVTVGREFYEKEVMKCLEIPSRLNSFLRLHLNVCVGQAEHFINMTRYDMCAPRRKELEGVASYGGFDLSSKHDLTSFALAFKDGDAVDLKVWHWLPKENAELKERETGIPYGEWERLGWITLTEGDYIDDRRIVEEVVDYCTKYKCQSINIDPYRAASIVNDLTHAGIDVRDYPQGYKYMHDPTEQLEKLVLAGGLRHGDDPCLRWQMSNLTIERNSSGHIRPAKKKLDSKIDGCVATIMAIAPWFPREDGLNSNPYLDGNLRTI